MADAGGLDQGFEAALQRLMKDANGAVGIVSGFRSAAQQQALYDASDKSGKMVAKPGTSWHEKGLAADLSFTNGQAMQWAHQHAADYGLFFPMSWEPWHVQPLWTSGKASTDAGDTGYTEPPDGHTPVDPISADPVGRVLGAVHSSMTMPQHDLQDVPMPWQSTAWQGGQQSAPSTTGGTPVAAGAPGSAVNSGSYQSTYDLLLKAGASPAEARVLAAVAGPESGYNPHAVSKPNTDGTVDRGLFQINSVHHQYDPVQLLDPMYNAKAALDIYRSQGPKAWTTFNTGAYKAYLPQGASQ